MPPKPLIESLKNFVDDVFGPPANQSALPLDFGNLTPEGITPLQPGGEFPIPEGRGPGTAELSGILQNRKRGFQTIDVNPIKFGDPQFQTRIPLSVISGKVGYDYDAEQTAATGVTPTTWRTIEFSIPGDSLRLEFLPGMIASTPNTALTANPLNNKKDNLWDVNFPDSAPAITGLQGEDRAAHYPSHVLVQFDDGGAPVNLAMEGFTYKLPFTKFFLTFKIGCPRFSVTIGNGATIEQASTDRNFHSDLALHPGYGMWNNPARHAQPFCFHQDGMGAPTSFTTSGVTYTLFDNENFARTVNNGCGVGWITSLSMSVCPIGGVAFPTYNHGSVNVSVYIRDTTGAKEFLIANLSTVIVYISDFAATATVIFPTVSNNKAFSPPVRFMLPCLGNTSSKLIVKTSAVNLSAGNLEMTWSMEGYLWGELHSVDRVTTSSTYFGYGFDALTTIPFPTDFSRVNV